MNKIQSFCFCIQTGCLLCTISNLIWTVAPLPMHDLTGGNHVIDFALTAFALGFSSGWLMFRPDKKKTYWGIE